MSAVSPSADFTAVADGLLGTYRETLREAPQRVPADQLRVVVATVNASAKRAKGLLETRGSSEAAGRLDGFVDELSKEDSLGRLLGWVGDQAASRAKSTLKGVFEGTVTVATVKAQVAAVVVAAVAIGGAVGGYLLSQAYGAGHTNPWPSFLSLMALVGVGGATAPRLLYVARLEALLRAWSGPREAQAYLSQTLLPREREFFAALGSAPPYPVATSVVRVADFAWQLFLSVALACVVVLVILGLASGLLSNFGSGS